MSHQFLSLLPHNKYATWYRQLICSRLAEHRSKGGLIYYESHHILPRSIHPEFANAKKFPLNVVLLTAREHYIAHLLLAKMFALDKKKYYKMVHALQCFVMCYYHERIVLPSWVVSSVRKRLSKMKEGQPAHNRGKKHTTTACQKMRLNHWLKRGGTHGMKGKKHTSHSIHQMKMNRSKWEYTIISPAGEVWKTRLIQDFLQEHNLYIDTKHIATFNGIPIPPPRSNIPQSAKKSTKPGRFNITGWTISRVAVSATCEASQDVLHHHAQHAHP